MNDRTVILCMFASYLRRCVDTIGRRRGEALRARLSSFGPRYDYEFRVEDTNQGRQALLRFEECRPRVLRCLYDQEKIIQSEDQERLLCDMRNTMLIKFYGSISAVQNDMPWLRGRGYVAADQTVHDGLAVLYPRRHGKTLTQAIVSVIVLLSQVRGNVLAYNYTNNHAHMWMSLFRRILDYMANDDAFGWTAVPGEDRKDTLTIRQVATKGGLATLKVFGNAMDGSKATSLRGTGAGAFLMNLDEFAFFHNEAFKVIFPAGANGAAIVLTSSRPPTKTTALELLEQTTKTGRQVLRSLDWRRLCDACAREEVETGRAKEACPHIARAPMAFRSFLAELRVMALLEPFDDAVRVSFIFFCPHGVCACRGLAQVL